MNQEKGFKYSKVITRRNFLILLGILFGAILAGLRWVKKEGVQTIDRYPTRSVEQTPSGGSMKYYVNNVTGSDATSNGSFSKPFNTIKYGLSRLVDGDSLYVMRGNYREGLISESNKYHITPIRIVSLGKVVLENTVFDFEYGSNAEVNKFIFKSIDFSGQDMYNNVAFYNNFKFINNTIVQLSNSLNASPECGYITMENCVTAYNWYTAFQPGSAYSQPMRERPPTHHCIYRNNINYMDGHNGLNAGNCLEYNLFENNLHCYSQMSWALFSANGGRYNHHNTFRNNIAFAIHRGDDGKLGGGGIVFGSTEDCIAEDNILFHGIVGLAIDGYGNDSGSDGACGSVDHWQCKPSRRNIARNNYCFDNFEKQIEMVCCEGNVLENNKTAGEGDLWGAGNALDDWFIPSDASIHEYPVGTYQIYANIFETTFSNNEGRLFTYEIRNGATLTPVIDSKGYASNKTSYSTGKYTVYNLRVIPSSTVTASIISTNLTSTSFITEFSVTPIVLTNLNIFVDKLTAGNSYTVLKNGLAFANITADVNGVITFTDTIDIDTTYRISGTNTRKPIAGNIIAKDMKYYDAVAMGMPATGPLVLKRRWLFTAKDDNGFGAIQNIKHLWRFFDSNKKEIFPFNPTWDYYRCRSDICDKRRFTVTEESNASSQAVIVEFPKDGIYTVQHTITNILGQSDTQTMTVEVISQYAEVEGYIKDSSGYPIEDASVTIITSNGSFTEISHANGYYCLQDIPMNKVHQIQVSKTGYNTYKSNTPLIDANIKQITDILLSRD